MRVLFLLPDSESPPANPSTVEGALRVEIDGDVTIGNDSYRIGTLTGDTMEVDGVTYFVVRDVLGAVTG